jgi:hypothetical protein
MGRKIEQIEKNMHLRKGHPQEIETVKQTFEVDRHKPKHSLKKREEKNKLHHYPFLSNDHTVKRKRRNIPSCCFIAHKHRWS